MKTIEEIIAYVRGRWEAVNDEFEIQPDDFNIAERSAYANVLNFIYEGEQEDEETEDESETD